jgi:hypothetical protein
MEVASNGVPRAVGQGRCALLPGLEVSWVNGAIEIRQGCSSGSKGEFDGSVGLSSVVGGLEQCIDPLWDSILSVA